MKRNPVKVKDVITKLSGILTNEYKNKLRECEEDELVGFHHTLGRMIRNDFGLWQGNTKLLKDCLRIQRTKYRNDYDYCKMFYKQSNVKIKTMHPDDASMVIIKELKRKQK